jgi:hypothetical protein
MVRYYYAWTPLALVFSIVFLALPWLGLIALLVVALAAFMTLALAVVYMPYAAGRAVVRRWQTRTAPALSPAPQQVGSVPAGAAVVFAHMRAEGGTR